MEILAVSFHKGGVGKTTSSITLADLLADRGQRVLLVDLSSQGHSTLGSGMTLSEEQVTMTEVLMDKVAIAEAIVSTAHGYDLLPADRSLTQAEVFLQSKMGGFMFLKSKLQVLETDYDTIVLDCPPSLESSLNSSALCAATQLLIPIQPQMFSMADLNELLETLKRLREFNLFHAEIVGLLPTMFTGTNVEVWALEELGKLGIPIFDPVPQRTHVRESQVERVPLRHYLAKLPKRLRQSLSSLLDPYHQVVDALLAEA